MLQTHVNNDIYNKYCLIHNNLYDTVSRLRTVVLPFLVMELHAYYSVQTLECPLNLGSDIVVMVHSS